MSRIRLIVHGKAAGRPEVREAVARQREAGHDVSVRVTWEAGDSQRMTREAADDGVDTVVAGGGDGTVNEVATGLVQWGLDREGLPALGVLPLGTANDFARSAAIPLDSVEALALVGSTEPVPVDLGLVGERVFVNVATGGFGTQVTLETPPPLKKALGGAAYFLTGVTKFTSIKDAFGSFRAPDFEWDGSFLVLAIGNARQAGGGHVLCPEARLDDGLLDVRILPGVPPDQVGEAMSVLMRDGLDAVERAIVSARVPWLEVEADEGISVNLDGEPQSGKKLRFEVVPNAIRLHVPASCPLLG
ncbi:MAG: lipid kinase YegS [Planctomycetota bacterium]|jgi:lipid kinase YegS